MRDKVGSFMTADNVSRYLNNWISQYVLLSDDAGDDIKARYPLREARVDVSEDPGNPGAYKCVIFLRPHFQLGTDRKYPACGGIAAARGVKNDAPPAARGRKCLCPPGEICGALDPYGSKARPVPGFLKPPFGSAPDFRMNGERRSWSDISRRK